MRTQAFVRAAALALSTALLSAGAVWAQQAPRTLTDTRPMPAEERNSAGAIVLMNDPVLAQRAQMEQLLARTPQPDTRAMGAGPARIVRQVENREAAERKRDLDAAEERQGTPRAP